MLRNSFAITFAGRRFSEEKLFSCAYAFEQATKAVLENPDRLVQSVKSLDVLNFLPENKL